jgi:hypothetical protein
MTTNRDRAADVAERIMETGGTVRVIAEALDAAERRGIALGRAAERRDVAKRCEALADECDERRNDACERWHVHQRGAAMELRLLAKELRAAHLDAKEKSE